MADPDFAADEETIQACEGRMKPLMKRDVPALAAIARKYQRALKVAEDALKAFADDSIGGSHVGFAEKSLAEVCRILEGGGRVL